MLKNVYLEKVVLYYCINGKIIEEFGVGDSKVLTERVLVVFLHHSPHSNVMMINSNMESTINDY